VAVVGTGPTLTPKQIDTARRKGFALAGCNNVWQIVPDLAVLYACNLGWWRHYWGPDLAAHPASKWTTNAQAAREFGVNWIREKPGYGEGLSKDPTVINHGHGSGFSLLNLVYLMGATRIVLLGYNLKYAPDYDGRGRRIGSEPRHYFGEYPPELQHWPHQRVQGGVHVELLGLYAAVADQRAVQIINCTPDSALTCFPVADIEDVT
jgi:hypothetical protein